MHADHESGANNGRDDLSHQARALRADRAKQRDRQRDRERRRRGAHGDDHAVSAEPAPAAAHDQHIDERGRERQRDHRDRERNRGDAHGEDLMRGRRRSEDEIEIGARIESARHRFHGLRNHQQPRQQQGRGDPDQHLLVEAWR